MIKAFAKERAEEQARFEAEIRELIIDVKRRLATAWTGDPSGVR